MLKLAFKNFKNAEIDAQIGFKMQELTFKNFEKC